MVQFNNRLAHRVEAGADLYLMPSRYEPCGLNQMYSLRYGTLPIVRATGGLDDTVDNYDPNTGDGTGFKFWDLTADAIVGTVSWAVDAYRYRPEHIRLMRARAMRRDFSWGPVALRYLEVYEKAVALRAMSL